MKKLGEGTLASAGASHEGKEGEQNGIKEIIQSFCCNGICSYDG